MKQMTSQLAALLREIADAVEQGDSFEGRIEYTRMDEGLEREEWEVSAAYRVGNAMGQGGMRILEPNANFPCKHNYEKEG
jgi:hypothetical protein